MQSNDLFKKSKEIIPGGVHSPVRSFKGLEMTPRFMKSAKGAYITDVEDNRYIDFCMSFGPLILGHADSEIESELKSAISRGWSFGACEHYSLELAKLITDRIDFIEQIRFVNSGTEAVMTALRLARGYTKKDKIIKFNGCYHGHTDSMLIKAGSGLAGEADASSMGIPKGISQNTLVLELGDIEGVQECFSRDADNIAAIIIEPLPANNGLLIQSREFLQALRDISKKHNTLLIFDEVISGFRAGFSGMSKELGITPDIVTYGKIIGGGLPVGAVAGSKKVMQLLAPAGGVYQAGTLSANPLAMVGGLATLKKLTDEAYKKIELQTTKITTLLASFMASKEEYKKLKIISKHSLFWITSNPQIKRACDIPSDIMTDFSPLFSDLLNRGIYLAPNPYEVGFVSLAHDEVVIEDMKKKLGM